MSFHECHQMNPEDLQKLVTMAMSTPNPVSVLYGHDNQ